MNQTVRQVVLMRRAAAVPAAPSNIIDPAGWGNPSNGTVTADPATGVVTFTASGNATNISNTPLQALLASTIYDWTAVVTNTSGTLGGKVQLRYGASSGTIVNVLVTGSSSGQVTTGASDLGDGKPYLRISNIGNPSGTVLVTFIPH